MALLVTLLCASVVQAQPLPREVGAKESPGGTGPAAPKGATGSAGPVGATGSAGSIGLAGPAGLAGLAAPSGPATFSLAGAPAGAEVAIDGTAVGVTPLGPRTPVSPGPHQLKVTRRGYSSYTRDFVAYAGRMVLLEIDLVPAYMVVRVRTGDAGAQVLVDEELRGETPIELELRPGPHQILVRRANFLDQSWPLTAVAGQEVERDVLLEEKPEQRRKEKEALPKERRFYTRWWVWTLAAVGAVGIASAIIIPTVLGQRSDCDKLGGEVCFPIQLGTPAMTTPALTVRF